MVTASKSPQIYDGDGDILMRREHEELTDRIVLTPDALPSRVPDPTPRIRILWGQHLLEDLLSDRYRSLICAVNIEDNSRGIICQLASLLRTSQWDEPAIAAHAKQFGSVGGKVKVIKFDMDRIEVLGILRPPGHKTLTLEDLAAAFRIISDMILHTPTRCPSASVSFLEARANALLDPSGHEPSFETVLRTMYDAGYRGDVYPSPSMWQTGPTGLYPRYPFAPVLEGLRRGGD